MATLERLEATVATLALRDREIADWTRRHATAVAGQHGGSQPFRPTVQVKLTGDVSACVAPGPAPQSATSLMPPSKRSTSTLPP